MNGYGSHTYMWINAAGEKSWVKYLFHTNPGMAFFTNAEAAAMAGSDADFHRRALFDPTARRGHPIWPLSVQAMPYEDAKANRYPPSALTQTEQRRANPLSKDGS